MKYINIKELSNTDYKDLSNLINDSIALTIEDKAGVRIEYDVADLKVDDDGVIYAPTNAHVFEETSTGDDIMPGGFSEARTVLSDYEPIYNLIER